MKVVVDCGVLEFLGVAEQCLKVALWRGDEVGVVEEEGSWEVVPPYYAVFCERS